MEKLHKIGEVAEILGISTSFIYKLAERGDIDSIKIGSALRFTERNVSEYIEKRRKINLDKSSPLLVLNDLKGDM
jgi:excisionase family DNA binding protein